MMLALLPHELVVHISTCLLARNRMESSRSLASTCKEFNDLLRPLHTADTARQHKIRWAIQRLEMDVVLRHRELHVSGADPGWRRAYGPPLLARKGCSTWEVRIDRSRANEGYTLLGVALQHRDGSCEWSLCPKDGRLYRRSWDRDSNVLCGEPPPPGYPNGHAKRMLVDAESGGEAASLKGRAQGSVLEVAYDHDGGTLSFRLNGGPRGAILAGFPKAATFATTGGQSVDDHEDDDEVDRDHAIGAAAPRTAAGRHQPRLLLRPVVGFRFGAGLSNELDDQVTIRSAPRLQSSWPQARRYSHESGNTSARGDVERGISIMAAKALRRALDASHASNRMRLASFRLSTK